MRCANNSRATSDWRSRLEVATTLLQRNRSAHPTAGLYEAADLQWWWRKPRSTDDLPQLFWFDHLGRPEAAVIATDWGERIALDPIVMPDAAPDWVAHVIERGLAHADESGFDAVGLELDPADDVLREVLVDHGFAIEDDGVVETWLAADARPEISPLHEDYRLSNRLDTMRRPHHMIHRNGPDVETRLRQTSLYAPTSTWWYTTVATASPPTGCSGTTPRRPRASSNPCAPKTITSDEDSPATSSRPASSYSPKPAQSASRSLRTGQPGIEGSLPQRRFEPFRQTVVSLAEASARVS